MTNPDEVTLELVEKVAAALRHEIRPLRVCESRIAARAALDTTPLVKLREALEACRAKFVEYVALHRAKLLPERTTDEFYQNARTAHNEEVREKVTRNQEMVDLIDAALSHSSTTTGVK